MLRWIIAVALFAACSANDDTPSPQLADVQPNPALAGSRVSLSGDHFCAKLVTEPGDVPDNACASPGEVYFGAALGTDAFWTDTVISVGVPNGVTGKVSLSVIVGGRPSNAISFTAN
jgi:hypothetical protein